ncbi:prephenate dehydratase [Megalodesulfovibrio paquesii]
MPAEDNTNHNAPASAPEARMRELREQIDGIDKDLLTLLNKRAACSREVGVVKAGAQDLIFKPFREKDVLDKLIQANETIAGTLPESHLKAIYREIFSSSRSLQRPQQVAYLGPEGTFSYFAGQQFLGHSVDFTPMHDLQAVFHAVHNRECELGIVPLENSLQGTVGQSLDLFLRYEVFIQAELSSRISHCLLGTVEDLAQVDAVYSHPQPLAQCGDWLRARLPKASVIPTESTAAAARLVAELGSKGKKAAAIGHAALAERHGLHILARSIEDMPDNWTRFVVIGASPVKQETRDKTSMLFTLPDKAGSLVRVLMVLSGLGINMKKLESRPLRGERWQYVFFVDVEADLQEISYRGALEAMREHCHTLRILGSYPQGPYLESM